jgi:predicted nucleotidyltransferase
VYGSIVSGKWGVGSDLDIVIEVQRADAPFNERCVLFPPPDVPVPYDVSVYSTRELEDMRSERRRFVRELDRQSVVLYDRGS